MDPQVLDKDHYFIPSLYGKLSAVRLGFQGCSSKPAAVTVTTSWSAVLGYFQATHHSQTEILELLIKPLQHEAMPHM